MEDKDKTRGELLNELKNIRLDLEQANLAISAANDGMFDWDVATSNIYFDARYYTMAGYIPNEFPGTFDEWAKRVHPEDYKRVDKVVKAYLVGDTDKYNEKFRFRCKNDEWIWIRARIKIVSKNKYGEPSRIIGTHTDIAEEVQLEEQLRQSQKMDALGMLTGGVTHDYNNLLDVIIGYSELLKCSLADQPKLAKYVENILRASNQGTLLTNKLLSFTREKPAKLCKLNINNILQDQEDILKKVLTAQVELSIELADELWPVCLDSADLESAILNMSINAMHAMASMDSEGKLSIRTCNHPLNVHDARGLGVEPGDYVQLSLTDTGGGIAKINREKIFDPFFSTKKEKGTGLGLSQVYGFVTRASGAISVHSELGYGTKFSLYFPRYA